MIPAEIARMLAAIAAAYVCAQALKVAYVSARARMFAWNAVFFPGGMPSAHSALVSSLTASVYATQGLTPLFVVALVFAMIVMYDAMTLRREVAAQKSILTLLQQKLGGKEMRTLLREEQIGHKPLEVLAGAAVGTLVALLVCYA